MAQSTQSKKSNADSIKRESASMLPLERRNFIMMAIAGALIIIGFLLMLGAGTATDSFNPDIFSTRRIVIGPLITFAGFVFMGVAIIIRPTKLSDTKDTESTPE